MAINLFDEINNITNVYRQGMKMTDITPNGQIYEIPVNITNDKMPALPDDLTVEAKWIPRYGDEVGHYQIDSIRLGVEDLRGNERYMTWVMDWLNKYGDEV